MFDVDDYRNRWTEEERENMLFLTISYIQIHTHTLIPTITPFSLSSTVVQQGCFPDELAFSGGTGVGPFVLSLFFVK